MVENLRFRRFTHAPQFSLRHGKGSSTKTDGQTNGQTKNTEFSVNRVSRVNRVFGGIKVSVKRPESLWLLHGENS